MRRRTPASRSCGSAIRSTRRTWPSRSTRPGPEHEALLFEIDQIIGEMHEDGTLTALSEEWFDEDLTQDPSGG